MSVWTHTHNITCPQQGDKAAVRLEDLSSYKLQIPQQHESWTTPWNSNEKDKKKGQSPAAFDSWHEGAITLMLQYWHCDIVN